ncbi:hypothetical protein M433DRAFT_318267 [Acidomyces richmondensis BFW]|nr:MAG: hypothetical protein FE78DRAFT_460368 [Acidomyces sp. 'richmondensis']KYG44164.1 hypothetical protein M433DRAFT_318267 [Acidomyces richmondensis BFW]
MPSPALSPMAQLPSAVPQSPHQGATTSNSHSNGSARPAAMKRHSSASSQGASRQHLASPGSAGEHHHLRHAVGGRQRHARIALPRNHSSGRNLAKLGRQAHQAGHHDDGRKHSRQRSHEGDTEIRLPGSLDESRPSIRRNMTANDLIRNNSRTKLKKNLSHGQLTRLNASSKNLAGLSSKAELSPAVKARSKRPKSAEFVSPEKDLHEQEMELLKQMQDKRQQPQQQSKKVGFAVGSSGDTSDSGEVPEMDGPGLQEDEWTDQSASASPFSTRQNTANNSRRASVVLDRTSERQALQPAQPAMTAQNTTAQPLAQTNAHTQESLSGPDGTPAQIDGEEEAVSPRSRAHTKQSDLPPEPLVPESAPQRSPTQHQQTRSPLYAAKDYSNPSKRLTSHQSPAPALVSGVSAVRGSAHASPANSMRSSRSNVVGGADGAQDHEEDELVSRFIGSTSHPSTGSGANTGAMNTPKQGSFHTPEDESTLHRAKTASLQAGPVSPGSTVSGSSGAATPALGRSRVELRMMHDKALADREAAAERQPLVPHHVFDRRNETLKSYLSLAHIQDDGRGNFGPGGLSLGPEIFQGRFKAINTELKVVEKFRSPIAESFERLQKCRGSTVQQRIAQHAAALKTSRSAVTLPSRTGSSRESSKLSTSISPPKNGTPDQMAKSDSPSRSVVSSARIPALNKGSESERRHPRRGVSFAGPPPQMRESEKDTSEPDPDAIARMLWESVGG